MCVRKLKNIPYKNTRQIFLSIILNRLNHTGLFPEIQKNIYRHRDRKENSRFRYFANDSRPYLDCIRDGGDVGGGEAQQLYRVNCREIQFRLRSVICISHIWTFATFSLSSRDEDGFVLFARSFAIREIQFLTWPHIFIFAFRLCA